jgi:hypothetical protein
MWKSRTIAVLALSFFFIGCSSLSITKVDGITRIDFVTPEQVKEIREKWNEYRPSLGANLFITSPCIKKPYVAGKLTDKTLIDGLNTTKFIRYLAGLSEDIELDPMLVEQAQYGAVLLAAYGELSHTPPKPTDMDSAFYAKGFASTKSSNIHMSVGQVSSLPSAVQSFCDDSDESNIDRLGHRRWILNPELKKIGFGLTTDNGDPIKSFVTMQVFDKSGSKKTKYGFVAWPSPGYFPINLFGAMEAWSLSLDPELFDTKKSHPIVKLTRMGDLKEWIFTEADKDKNGQYFAIERTGYGLPYCIIFRPKGGTDLLINRKYEVEVAGIYDKHGSSLKIEYSVEFFLL